MPTLRLVAFAVLLASPLAGQGGTGFFVARLGRDTLALERETRTGNRLVGDFFATAPRSGAGGEIRFDWDRVRWVLPFSVR